MSAKKKILITDRFAQDSFLWLQRHPNFEVVKGEQPSAPPQEHLLTAHALLIRSRTVIDEKMLKKARQLQLIVTATSGFDHIDLEACTKWGITVMHTPAANIESAAQLTWALTLSCASKVREARRLIESGDWARDKIIGMELSGRTLGIVGLGRIGSRVARHAQTFGMNVVAHDPYVEEIVFDRLNAQRLQFEELLRASDIVTFHVPKTAETEGMLNRGLLERIPRGFILINTSRGTVVPEADLIEGLEKGWIRSAGLDVFEKEPLPTDSGLLNNPHVVLTPHIGANTEEAFFKASQMAAEKTVGFFLDGGTSDTLPPRVPWYGAPRPGA